MAIWHAEELRPFKVSFPDLYRSGQSGNHLCRIIALQQSMETINLRR